MKKPSIDTQKIKAFFAQHVEKLVVGACFLLMCYFAYGALTTETYDRNPYHLQTTASEAERRMSQSEWDPGSLAFIDYGSKASKDLQPSVNSASFRLKPFHPELYPQGLRRGNPRYFTVRDLQVAGLNAAIATTGDGEEGAKRTTGASMVCLTGFVPAADQQSEYDLVFADALKKDPKLDKVQYVVFAVERAEVVNGKAGAWQELSLREAARREQALSGRGEPVVEEGYIHPVLTRPIVPLVGQKWTPSAVAHPNVRLKSKEDTAAEPKAPAVNAPQPPPAQPNNPFANPFNANNNKPNNRSGKTPSEEKPAATAAVVETPRGFLFRFFDLTVEQGKSYQYRVKLVLRNPNYGIPKQFLAEHAFGDGEFRESPWSEASPQVTLPRDLYLLVKAMRPAKAMNEPEATVVAKKFSKPHASFLTKEESVARGKLANWYNTECQGVLGDSKQAVQIVTDLVTDMIVVDMEGGESLGDRRDPMIEPAEMLILDPVRGLVVRNEIEASAQLADAGTPPQANPGAPAPGGNSAAPPAAGGNTPAPKTGGDLLDQFPLGGDSSGGR